MGVGVGLLVMQGAELGLGLGFRGRFAFREVTQGLGQRRSMCGMDALPEHSFHKHTTAGQLLMYRQFTSERVPLHPNPPSPRPSPQPSQPAQGVRVRPPLARGLSVSSASSGPVSSSRVRGAGSDCVCLPFPHPTGKGRYKRHNS